MVMPPMTAQRTMWRFAGPSVLRLQELASSRTIRDVRAATEFFKRNLRKGSDASPDIVATSRVRTAFPEISFGKNFDLFGESICLVIAHGGIARRSSKPVHVWPMRVAGAATNIVARKRLNISRQEEQVDFRRVPRDGAVGVSRRKRGSVGAGSIRHGDHKFWLMNIGKFCRHRQIPRAEIHVHAVRKEIGSAGILGDGTNKN